MIPIIELIRLEESFDYGTFGVLRIHKQVFCVTLEPADFFNAENKSSIPAQQYTIRRHLSPKYGQTFQVMNVPGRESVLIHPGNRIKDTLGCILLGQYFDKLKGDRAILNSGTTFNNFMRLMQGVDVASLTIYEHY